MRNTKEQNSRRFRLPSGLDQPERPYVEHDGSLINYTVTDEGGTHSGSVPVANVDSIHYETMERNSSSGLIWAALSIFLGLICYLIIENTFFQIASVCVSASMALYLVYTHYSETAGTELIICTALAEIRIILTGKEREREILIFTKSVLDYKSQNENVDSTYPRVFSPR